MLSRVCEQDSLCCAFYPKVLRSDGFCPFVVCRFPIFLTMVHLTVGFFLLSPFMTLPYFAKQHGPTLKAQWKGITCVGTFKVCLQCIPFKPSCL